MRFLVVLQILTQKQFDKFVNKVRRAAYELPLRAKHLQEGTKFVRPTIKDINKVLSLKEVKTIIIEDFAVGFETNGDIVLDDDSEKCGEIFNAVFQRLINNELCLMASEGILDCYFDDEEEDFIFKLKE